VALVLSMVLVLMVQVGVWLLVMKSGRSGGDGVGSAASFLFGSLVFNGHLKFQVLLTPLWKPHHRHLSSHTPYSRLCCFIYHSQSTYPTDMIPFLRHLTPRHAISLCIIS